MKGTKKYGNKIFIITENQTNALREEINMADYPQIRNRPHKMTQRSKR